MGRLVSWPRGLAVVESAPLTGPRAVGGAATESLTGFVQTTASAFGAWRWSLTLQPMRGALFRRYRGMVTALHGGANAVRVPFCDRDIMSWEESGVEATNAEAAAGEAWSNGLPWSNGQNWGVGRPWEQVEAAAALGDTVISITGAWWGNNLVGGEWIGFAPYHLGLYIVTEVITRGNSGSPEVLAEYRIWPPLRKALTTESRVTLTPVMAMRLESEGAATATRGRVLAEGNSLTMVEVEDSDVRNHFSE